VLIRVIRGQLPDLGLCRASQLLLHSAHVARAAHRQVDRPLTGKSIGRSWLLDERGDDMGAALGSNTIDEVIAGFEQLTALWGEGLQLLRKALSASQDQHAKEELDTAAVCWHAFRSITHFCKIYRLRKAWEDRMLPEYQQIIGDELQNLQAVLPILQHDARFGYHIEAHGYQYDARGVAARIKDLKSPASSPSARTSEF
jgi:hypothetical protein